MSIYGVVVAGVSTNSKEVYDRHLPTYPHVHLQEELSYKAQYKLGAIDKPYVLQGGVTILINFINEHAKRAIEEYDILSEKLRKEGASTYGFYASNIDEHVIKEIPNNPLVDEFVRQFEPSNIRDTLTVYQNKEKSGIITNLKTPEQEIKLTFTEFFIDKKPITHVYTKENIEELKTSKVVSTPLKNLFLEAVKEYQQH